jgi:hypothetical protein
VADSDTNQRPWTFVEYVSGRGLGTVTAWLAEGSVTRRAEFHTRLRFLAPIRNRLDWEDSSFRKMRRAAGRAGLYEIRWKADSTQWRVLGFFRDGQREFVMVMGCSHKQQIYTPRDAIEKAIDRKGEIEKNHRQTRIYDYA